MSQARLLDLGSVGEYVLSRGTLSAASVVDGSLVIRDASSRNRNFKIETQDGGLLVKQGIGATGNLVAHEAKVYRCLEDARCAPFLPRYRDFDPDSQILTLELIRDAEDVRSHHLRLGQPPLSIGALIGEALAALHASEMPMPSNPSSCSAPPFYSVYRPSLEVFRNASSANLQLIQIVQNSVELCSLLDHARSQLKCEAFLHNDLKWDNMLLSGSQITLIDWETAAHGDPACDLGAVFGQYLSWWIFSVPVSEGVPAENYAELARFPLDRLRAALNACWSTYFWERSLPVPAANRLLLRAVRMTAVRLLHSAYEASQFATQLTSNDILHLQLAQNILTRPAEACRELLGIAYRDLHE